MHRTRYSVKCFFLPLRLLSLPLKRVCMSQHVRIYKVVRVIDGPVLLPSLGEAVVGLPAIGVDGQPGEIHSLITARKVGQLYCSSGLYYSLLIIQC